MDVFNEKSGVEFTAHFSDTQNSPTIPSTVHWNHWCETNKREVSADALITPVIDSGESGIVDVYASIEVPGWDNALINPNNARELRTILVIADKGLSSEVSQTYQYYVKNLRGRS